MRLPALSLVLCASWLTVVFTQKVSRSEQRTARSQLQTKSRMAATMQRLRREPPRDCSDAPNLDTKNTCKMIRHMDHIARRRAARQAAVGNSVVEDTRRNGAPTWQQPIPLAAGSRGQAAYHPYDCMTIICLCPFFRGTVRNGNCILSNGAPLQMAYRKEYRMMTDDERNRWHNALNVLKRNGEYDRLSAQHLSVGTGSGAHSGPGFLPWHREYLKRFEIALRLVDPAVAVPYWDSVMDWYLPDARDSILFSNMFAGESDYWGNVIQGPFAYWRTLEGRSTINRQLARKGRLFDEQQINNIVAQNAIEFTLAFTAPQWGCPYGNNYGAIEYTHSNIHLWIGGDMEPPSTSANEPIFFMHHSFVDYLWELWRQLKQPRWIREQSYAPDHWSCSNVQHFRNAIMRPFPYLVNADGLANGYTDQMYRYAPRATCSFQNPSCGSPYLFCDTRGFPHCVAKIKPGGSCQGFEMFNACYRGRCWFGRCQLAREIEALSQEGVNDGVEEETTVHSKRHHHLAEHHTDRAQSARRRKALSMPNVDVDFEHDFPIRRRRATFARGAKTLRVEGNSTKAIALKQKLQEVALVKKVKVKMAAPLFVDCYNRHECCESWESFGGCDAQPEYMSVYCQATCGLCTPAYNTTDACSDRHPHCKSFKKMGHCTNTHGKNFMMENCRAACGVCEKPRSATCKRGGKIISMPITKRLLQQIAGSDEPEVVRRLAVVRRRRV
ncbi:unnamed protein product, partial [Mesorhabditis belari]|uniref:ShKT domain-containing protein n=1 Tax=Mesorhabditis belari TaxID=2138241 RepID=A0AAF3E7Y5_9BILA